MPHLPPVTVLGLGAMGRALAAAFVAAGHPTTVWNRTTGRATGLTGVRVAPTARDAVRSSDLVVVCLLDDDVVSSVLDGSGPALAGRTVVDLTNTTPAQARARSAWVSHHGGRHLDGGIMAVPPMIGSEQALVLYSGDRTTFDDARPVLTALGGAHHLGDEPGLASLHDIALLSAMYGLFGGVLHAFALVRAAGLSATALVGLLAPWLEAMLSSLGPTAAEIDDGPVGEADSPLSMQAAAFPNLLATALDQGVRDDLLAPVGRLLSESVAAGHGDRDIAVLVEVLAPGGQASPGTRIRRVDSARETSSSSGG